MKDELRHGGGLALLSFTAGSMDAIAFLALGEVFTSAMSGNTILLGLALGQGRMSAALHSLAAFGGYIVGVALAVLPLRAKSGGIGRILALEILLLAIFAGLWTLFAGPTSPPEIYALIVLSAIAMGLQGAVGREIREQGIPTGVITSTLTAIIGSFTERALAGERPLFTAPTRQQAATFLVYLASAVLTGFVVTYRADVTPFLPLAAMILLVAGLRLRLFRLQ